MANKGERSGCFEMDHETPTKCAGSLIELIDFGAAMGIEDAAHLGLTTPHSTSQLRLSNAGMTPGLISCHLRGEMRGQSDKPLAVSKLDFVQNPLGVSGL